MLKKLADFLTSRWFISLVGAGALALLMWFLGPLIAFGDARPLEDTTPRLAAGALILLIWALAMQWSLLRQQRTNARMVDALTKPAGAQPTTSQPDLDQTARDEELAILRRRLTDAMASLKRTRFKGAWGQRYLYELPWFLILGAAGAGKTTALLNSGLKFPLAAATGGAPLRDLGGTRNCDWWFSDEAVLIDTAGRYATQDTHRSVDGPVWLGFLDLLKGHRSRQPINGLLLALSVPDLIAWTEAERAEHAHTLKQRIRELQEQLGIRFPIYVMLTKADVLAGFTPYFEDLPREERAQVWGMTLPLDHGADATPALPHFTPAFDDLVNRLGRRLGERLHLEPDAQRRGMAFAFPSQVAALKIPLADVLEIIFAPNRYEERPLLRGVYLTSGAQDGSSSDAFAGAFAGAFALTGAAGDAYGTEPPAVRSFFITRLLREVVFQEANLAGVDHIREGRRRWRARVAMAAMIAAATGLTGFWLWSAVNNRTLLEQADQAADRAATALTPLATPPASLTRINDTDFAAVVPVLNALAAAPGGWDQRDQQPAWTLTGGLYQGRRIGGEAQAIYLKALRTALLSRLYLRLEEQLRRERSRPDYLYQALKVYLMLGGQGQPKGAIDGDLIVAWMRLDWLSTLPGPEKQGIRDDLARHLSHLVEQRFAPIPVDEKLVAEARATLSQASQAERGFERLQGLEAVKALPPWRMIDKAGPLASRALLRPSGRALSDGVDGLYTAHGFLDVAQPALSDIAQAMTDEGWVLGQPDDPTAKLARRQRLEKDILALYLNEYARVWDEVLGDVAVTPYRSLNHAADVLNVLSGPQSPLKALLTAVAQETNLTPPADTAGTPATAAGPGSAAVNAVQNAQRNAGLAQGNLASLAKLAGVDLNRNAPPPGQPITDRFKTLRDYVTGANGAPAPIDEALKRLAELYQQVARAANAPDQNAALLAGLTGSGTAGGDRGQLVAQLKALARDMPAPLGGMVAATAQNAAGIAVGGARAQINQAWKINVLPLCGAALEGRFPIVPGSSVDVAPADFTKLFAPGGLLDQFFNTNLKPFVNQTASPWVWQKADGVDLGIPQSALTVFERAARIRDALFPNGAAAPRVVFEITPLELDARATQATLEVDGQSLLYRHGPPIPQIMRWPAGDGPSSVRFAFGPPLPGQPAALVRTGNWSLFRFLAAGTLTGGAQPERFTFAIRVGDRSATYTLRADSINNPFGQNLLEGFKCPASL